MLRRRPTQLHQLLILPGELLQLALRLLRLLVSLHHLAQQHVAHHAELLDGDEAGPSRAGRGSGARRELAVEPRDLGGEDRFVLVEMEQPVCEELFPREVGSGGEL